MFKRLVALLLLCAASPVFAAASISANVSALPAATSAYPVTAFVNILGSSTAFPIGGMPFTVSGCASAAINAQTVTSATVGQIQLNPGSCTGPYTLTITDTASGDGSPTLTITVQNYQCLTDCSTVPPPGGYYGFGDNFNRPNSFGSTSSLGNNWTNSDSTWQLLNNEAYNNTAASNTTGHLALRPASVSFAPERALIQKATDASNVHYLDVVRVQSNGVRYSCDLGGVTISIASYNSSGTRGALVNSTTQSIPYSAQYNTGDVVSLDCSVYTNGSGNPVITAIWNDYTSGAGYAISTTDSSAGKITTAGQMGFDGSLVGSFVTSVQVATLFYQNAVTPTVSMSCTPGAVQSSATNTTLTCNGVGTTWQSTGPSLTLGTSGSFGAAIGSPSVVSNTQFTVVLTNSGSQSDTLVINDITSGAKATVQVTSPYIFCLRYVFRSSYASGSFTCYGNVQTWLTSAPVITFTGTAGSGNITGLSTTVVSNTQLTVSFNVGSTTGTFSMNDTNSSFPASVSMQSVFMIGAGDSNIIYPPHIVNLTSNYADINYASAEPIQVTFTTTNPADVYFDVDTSANVSGGLSPGNYPSVQWSCNPGLGAGNPSQNSACIGLSQWQFFQAVNQRTKIISALPAGTTTLYWYPSSIQGNKNDTGRWTDAEAIHFVGIEVDPSAVTVAGTKRPNDLLSLGDSITAAVSTGCFASPSCSDSKQGYVRALCDALLAECGDSGIPGQAWAYGTTALPAMYLSSNTPADTYSYQYNGVSRLSAGKFSPTPTWITINQGTNDVIDSDATLEASVQSSLADLRTKSSAQTWLIVFIPFDQNRLTAITTGYNNYVAANPNDQRTCLINPNLITTTPTYLVPPSALNDGFYGANAYAWDSIHPTVWTSEAFGARAALQIQACMMNSITLSGSKTLLLPLN